MSDLSPDDLFPKLELLGNCLISAGVSFVEIVQKSASLTDHHQKTSSRTVVFLVLLKVLRETIDSLRENGDLNVRRPGVLLMKLEIRNQFSFFHSSAYRLK